MSTRVPTPENIQRSITVICQTDWLSYLYSRWQDEREYEDINDYGKAFTKNTGWEVVKSHKRPFGFTFKHPDMPGALYQITMTARSAGWKRVA